MAAEGALHQFGNILLGGRGGMNPGQLKIHPGGFVWRKTGGGKAFDVLKADISALSWTRLPKGYQLAVKTKTGSNVRFSGFREQVSTSRKFLAASLHDHVNVLPYQFVHFISLKSARTILPSMSMSTT
jgi:hypothetical protein